MKNLKFALKQKCILEIQNCKQGFTLIELLIVIAIIAIVASVIFVALDPVTRFKDARNAQRWRDVEAVADAVRIYQVDNKGQVPSGVDQEWRMLGTSALGCDVICGANEVSGSYDHNNQADFDSGLYSNTHWDNINNWVELFAGSSGTYTSPVVDAGVNSSWTSFSWVPERPTYKALPNNKANESGYSTGNADMSDNVLLYHFDQSAGTVVDSSGNGNNGSVIGATWTSQGKLGGAYDFDGIGNYISVGNPLDQLNLKQEWTVSAWVNISGTGAKKTQYLISGLNLGLSLDFSSTNKLLLYLNSGIGGHDYYVYSDQAGLLVNQGWKYVTFVFRNQDGFRKIYVDGKDHTGIGKNQDSTPIGLSDTWKIGYLTDGMIDELQIYDRVLSPTEILDQYKRGALRLNFQVRSCNDAVCAGESFVGPDGTGSTYYNELSNSSISLPSFDLIGLDHEQYFQYRASFATDNTLYSPELNSVTIETTAPSEGGVILQSSCLDLTTKLVDKLPTIPEDPSVGSQEKTYYALQRDSMGQINVQACGAEDGVIKISR